MSDEHWPVRPGTATSISWEEEHVTREQMRSEFQTTAHLADRSTLLIGLLADCIANHRDEASEWLAAREKPPKRAGDCGTP